MARPLHEFLPDPDRAAADGFGDDDLVVCLTEWAADRGLELYPHQEEAVLELLSGSNVILATPTGSGKSLVALAVHARSVVRRHEPRSRSWYTAPVKALVTEKFFDLCRELGAEHVGLLTGDSAVNPDAPVICCTTEILALAALRDGPDTDAGTVVLDEFHFYGDPDRGWAWQVPLLALRRSSFLLLSATLGDVTAFRRDLTARTGRDTALVDDAVRPVPLRFEYRRTLSHHTVEELLAHDGAPIYLVNFSQRDALSTATAMASLTRLDDRAKAMVADELSTARLRSGFGKDLARLLRNGVGVHHAGMLPRYRRIVERLTQAGALSIVSGTDTLGIGVNLPIRTVLLTRLYKYDGTTTRLLSAREFHQIAGRAGRAGFDTEGVVIAQAPEHVAENETAAAKAANDPAKKRKLKKAAPPKGFVAYDEDTFTKLQSARPEPLVSSMRVTPGMLLTLLDRPGDTWAHCRELLTDNHADRTTQRRLIRQTVRLFKALEVAGIVRRLEEPDHLGRWVEVDHELQDDFALDQLLSPFLFTAIPALERDDEHYALALLALVESVVDNPFPILLAQKDKAKDEAMAAMKAAGVEYDERIAELEKITHPQPLRDEIYALFDAWRGANPWIGDRNIAPKGVVRDLWDRSMDFPTFVAYLGIKRSEGLFLRYLSDVYKTLQRAVPDDAKTDEVDELVTWLGAVIRSTDSSLLDEWASLRDGAGTGTDGEPTGGTAVDGAAVDGPSIDGPSIDGPSIDGSAGIPAGADDITADRAGFRALVRSLVFRWVTHLALCRFDTWADELAEAGVRGWSPSRLAGLLDAVTADDEGVDAPAAADGDAHGADRGGPRFGIDADARSPQRFVVHEDGDRWRVEQILADPAGYDEWYLAATVDLAASAREGIVVADLDGLHRR